MKIAFEPKRINIDANIKLFAAGSNCFALVDEKNYVLMVLGRFIPRMVLSAVRKKLDQ